MIYYRAEPPKPWDTRSQVPLFWIKIKSALFQIGKLLFHEGNVTEKCASSSVFAPDHDVGSDKKVSKSYCIRFFFHFGRPPLWKMVQQTCCRGVQSPPFNKQVCKKKSLNKELTRIFDFQFATLALKLNLLFRKILLSEKYQGDYVGKFFEKYLWMNRMNVEDVFILQLYEKGNSFRDFLKDFSPKFEGTSRYLLPQRFLIWPKNLFYVAKILWRVSFV